ncbi:MAG: B12-binding domain-containing radical SAM protein [Proteobacteria bacterium]|nr:B12-binding domain-containing radical SAM protein [Pseudomonadota bacterium]
MKTLMLNLPHHSTPFPLGMTYVAGYLQHEVIGFDAFWWTGHLKKENPQEDKETRDARIEEMMMDLIAKEKPDIIGFTFHRFSDLDDTWLKKLRNNHKDVFLLGGGGLVSVPGHREKTLENTELDAIIFGEGEETARELEDALANGDRSRFHDIRGLSYKVGDKIITNTSRPAYPSVDHFYPDRSIFPGLGKGEDAYDQIAVYTSRGCFWNCSFCSVTKLANEYGIRKRRAQSPERILDGLNKLGAKRKIDVINVFDDDFLGTSIRDYERAHGMFVGLSKLPDLEKIIFEATPRGIVTSHTKTPHLWEVFRKLEKAGIEVEISIGVETMSEGVLDRMGKKTNYDINLKAVEIVREYGSPESSFNYVMYLDDEMTRQELKESIDGFYKLLALLPASGHKTLMNKTMVPTAGSDSYDGLQERSNLKKFKLPVAIDGQHSFTTYNFQDDEVAKSYVLIEYFKNDLDELYEKGVDVRNILFTIVDNANTLEIPGPEITAMGAYYDIHFKRGFMRKIKSCAVTKKVEAMIQSAKNKVGGGKKAPSMQAAPPAL